MMRIVACVVIALTACQPAPVGVQNVELQQNSAAQCAAQCQRIGLPLDSVVIMANNVGCVCRNLQLPPPGVGTPPPEAGAPPGASASVGGMAAIMIAQEEAARRRRSDDDAARRRRQQSSSPKPYRPKY